MLRRQRDHLRRPLPRRLSRSKPHRRPRASTDASPPPASSGPGDRRSDHPPPDPVARGGTRPREAIPLGPVVEDALPPSVVAVQRARARIPKDGVLGEQGDGLFLVAVAERFEELPDQILIGMRHIDSFAGDRNIAQPSKCGLPAPWVRRKSKGSSALSKALARNGSRDDAAHSGQCPCEVLFPRKLREISENSENSETTDPTEAGSPGRMMPDG